jgi:hypothetical protein
MVVVVVGALETFLLGGALCRDREIRRVCYGPPVILQVSVGGGGGGKLRDPNGREKKEL